MTIDDAEHYTPEQRAGIAASYPPHEREARTKGDAGAGLRAHLSGNGGRASPVEAFADPATGRGSAASISAGTIPSPRSSSPGTATPTSSMSPHLSRARGNAVSCTRRIEAVGRLAALGLAA